ncbi:SusC/RagA family TonB-linked outer membrane protein [Wenyingzhuangia marina]|uniref:TonB-linked outer membrane protein, SusC/RagA family n=1 Tax=Wenyingzhuangia marina TaxID=1195760 RepID=A0A1M5V343_9FLAO|nr:TonB-dependent receptor [Wenyingzhuangia marina]SHH69641.1 TonB-linked outer membrane protein, SusC/RagA family [Wenyingzhuangia marina]
MKKNNFSPCRKGVLHKSRFMHKGVLFIFLFFLSIAMFAQQKKNITGVVTDYNGEPLIGVTVLQKGTSNGVYTGFDGEFSISVPLNEIIVFTYVGFKTREVVVRKETPLKIKMAESSESLDEVVIVAFGKPQKKESIVGAVSKISGDKLMSVRMGSSVENSLQGRLPGLTVIMTDPTPGEEALGNYYGANPIQMSIRGNSSMGSNSPLIIVDGVERPFSNLDPNDIESISILKDASATAVYGVKGANGVIIVTTKRGKKGVVELDFSATVSMKTPAILPEYMNAYETMKLRNEAWANDGLWDLMVSDEVLNHYRDQDLPYLYPDFDWMDYYFKPAFDQTYNLNARGGNNFVQYYASIGYLKEGDIWSVGNSEAFPYSYDKQNAHYGSKRYNFKNNLDFNLSKSSKLTINLGGNIKEWGKPEDTFTQPIWYEPVTSLPYYPEEALQQYPDNSIPYNQTGVRPFLKPGQGEVEMNWIGAQGFKRYKSNEINADIKFNQKLDFITKGLSIDGLYSYNSNVVYERVFNLNQYFGYYLDPVTQQWGRYDNGGGVNLDTPQPKLQVNNTESVFKGWRSHYIQGTLAYNRSFGKHSVSGLGLFSRRESLVENLAQFPHYEENWVGSGSYSYDDRYFLEASVAHTGSEKFAPGLRFGTFPAGGLGWVISNEEFFDNLSETVNMLKLKYSYGVVGSDVGIARWLYQSEYNQSGVTNFGFPRQNYGYINEGSLPIKNATWEKAYKQNVGLELGLFRDLVTLNVDLFDERREDILQPRQRVPAWAGVPTISSNIGTSKSHGFEVELGFNKAFNDGSFITFKGNLTAQENRMVYYDESKNVPFNLKAEGKPVDIARRLGSYTPGTGIVDKGFYQNFDELFLWPRAGGPSPIVGDLKFLDFNGDGTVDGQDRVVAESLTIPAVTWNGIIGGGYKNLSLELNFYGISSVQTPMRQGGMFYLYPFTENKNNAYTAHADHWSATNTNAQFPSVHAEATKQYNYQISSFSMIEGQYFRLRSANLRYTIQSDAMKKTTGISSLDIGLIGTNLFTWRKRKWGGDPEGGNYGVDFGAYPQMKRYTLELRAKF